MARRSTRCAVYLYRGSDDLSMLFVVPLAAVAALLIFLQWLLPFLSGTSIQFKRIDLTAFQNLTSAEDDVFLKKALPADAYRIAKRLRTRAVQEYLLMIAHDCAAVQVAAASSIKHADTLSEARIVRETAFQVRLLSLLLWSGLWLQWLFPNLDVKFQPMLEKFKAFAMQAIAHFGETIFGLEFS